MGESEGEGGRSEIMHENVWERGREGREGGGGKEKGENGQMKTKIREQEGEKWK